MPEAHIVRFKVLRIDCTALTKGQQYTITYRRGETFRSTPCYVADNNYVDFSPMPEGSAVVHFKSGGLRFLPKWINIRVEEYIRGRARKAVGETRVDCAGVLGASSKTAATTVSVSFSLHGSPAKMTVALLVYPEKHAPLSFNNIIPQPSGGNRDGRGVDETATGSRGHVKRMATDDVVTLLLALEGLAERRRANIAQGIDKDSPLKARIAELEEKRRAFSGVEGMAQGVVQSRTVDLISAQYLALSQTHRANFTGHVAAYLRQLAASTGVPVTLDISRYTGATIGRGGSSSTVDATQERLQRMQSRIEMLSQQIKKLEGEKTCLDIEQSLSRSQGSAEELKAITAKIESLTSQRQLLQRSCATIEGAGVKPSGSYDHTPVVHEVIGIRARILALSKEEEQLREKVLRMSNVTVGHVLRWARSKDPPMEEVRKDDTGLSGVAQGYHMRKENQSAHPLPQNPVPTQTPQKTEEPEKAAHNSSTQQSSENDSDTDSDGDTAKVAGDGKSSGKSSTRTSRITKRFPDWGKIRKSDMYGATGLPSANDFEGGAGSEQQVVSKGSYGDPLAPDLGSSMFSTRRQERAPPQKQEQERKNSSLVVGSDLPQLNFDAPLEDTTTSGHGGFFSSSFADGPTGSIPAIQIVSVDDDAFTYDVGETEGNNFVADDSITYNTFQMEGSSTNEPAFSITPSGLPTYSFESGGENTFSTGGNEGGLPVYNFGSDHLSVSKDKRESGNHTLTFNFGS
ncbi:hypothetical protein, conserved [Trypanosoma brucei gambiense DAL972]|uniref:Uncharacterized protein n=1 Tax=Trypanosoma brucei gambiense (strain MHOM/CI/86/DAL972) TaxID=679716 RepID=C9ZVH1_TRYB9|nr:hypothetical protein, conserved [Trypanosoma brucei gambiense DAL972]CBH13409.1 hypothetical protein, conserved [Trypanosoma brucei gambiense DAL972]|eukprot:XP_011775686.1 hypothetical protein, conserved [Trypanosoma brucei gambiense DAL972]